MMAKLSRNMQLEPLILKVAYLLIIEKYTYQYLFRITKSRNTFEVLSTR
jgi:hypothetical protein